MGCFAYAGEVIETFKTRLLVSLVSALGATLLGLLSATISRNFPYMRLGWRKLWWLNTLICGFIAGFLAAGVSAIILAVLKENPNCIPGNYVYDTATSMMELGIAVAAFWGAAFGTWFALRLDKYFVESI